MINYIKKRDGKIDRFDSGRIRRAIEKAVNSVFASGAPEIVENIYESVVKKLNSRFSDKNYPSVSDVEDVIMDIAIQNGYEIVAEAYRSFRDKRAEVRKVLSVAGNQQNSDTTDAALLIESDSKEIVCVWDRKRIEVQLMEEADLASELAAEIAKIVENIVVDLYQRGVRKLSTTDIRGLVDLVLRQKGLDIQRKKQALLGLPSIDLEAIIFSRSLENSNIASNNPESVNLEIAERIQKQYALDRIFSSEVAEAHLNGMIHIHDLGYPTRVYCSSHSLEYIKKYGLGDLLCNLESKSNPPKSAAVLNQHVQTFLASLQAHYAGALGFGYLNIFYAPLINRPVRVVVVNIDGKEYEFEKADFQKLVKQKVFSDYKIVEEKFKLKELSEKDILQIAQNLIFASSQNAFSRGGQTLFIDFNIHTNVPDYLKNVPAIGPGGKYMIEKNGNIEFVNDVPRFNNPDNLEDPRNGDADNSKIDGRILVYGDFEETSQKFARALLEIWRRGDKFGRPFHFPKCDLHVEEESFSDERQRELIDFACQVSAENGSVYFMFDRGNGAVLAQCCRLKEKIEDISKLKYPERLRFCGFQNVTINIAQAVYRGKDLRGCFRELDRFMELALKAHKQKAKFMQSLLDEDGSPMRGLGRTSDDGTPYIDLRNATYIIGVIGLNEAVQVLTGKQLHESEEAYITGLKIIAFMYRKVQEMKKREGLKFTLEETPAESATRRLAKIDLKNFEIAHEVVKGTAESPYYTNSIHFAPDADVGIIDRVVGQSKFHEMIESGAIVHAYIGEQRPDKDALKHVVERTLKGTRCAQLVFSPTYTECDLCGNIMRGDKELCDNLQCKNHFEESVDKRTLFSVTRIVGYYSRIAHWNDSQVAIYQARKKAENFYWGKGRDMNFLYNPNHINKLKVLEFGKRGCDICKSVKNEIMKKISELKLEGKVEFKVCNLDEADEEALSEAAMYEVPFDSVPTIVVAGKKGFWKKTTLYGAGCTNGVCGIGFGGKNDFIQPQEIEVQIKNRLEEVGVEMNKED